MTLNIVSLIDIFTVLVFFLLLNSTELELLPETKLVHLPESVAEARPHETIVVMVNNDEILVQGNTVARVADVLKSPSPTIPALHDALAHQVLPATATPTTAATTGDETSADDDTHAVTIMGDKEIPYKLLKKILATCADSDFGKLSLAVLQKAGGKVVPPGEAAGGAP